MTDVKPSRLLLLAAFAATWLVWGTTSLATHRALQTIPPFFLVAVRCLGAAGLLLAWRAVSGRATGVAGWSGRTWAWTAVTGGLLFISGQGLAGLAQRCAASSATAVLLASIPVWLALFEAVAVRRRPGALTLGGMGFGLVGVWVLLSPQTRSCSILSLQNALLLTVSAGSWAAGSLLARLKLADQAVVPRVGMQLVFAAGMALLVGLARGEPTSLGPVVADLGAMGSLVYLTVGSSALTFAAYAWLLDVSTPVRAATYAFINPAIAVAVGHELGGEPITPGLLGACALITLSVVMILADPARAPTESRFLALQTRPGDPP